MFSGAVGQGLFSSSSLPQGPLTDPLTLGRYIPHLSYTIVARSMSQDPCAFKGRGSCKDVSHWGSP